MNNDGSEWTALIIGALLGGLCANPALVDNMEESSIKWVKGKANTIADAAVKDEK